MTANMAHEGKLYPVLMENIKSYYPSVAKIIEKVTMKGQEEKQINDTCSWMCCLNIIVLCTTAC